MRPESGQCFFSYAKLNIFAEQDFPRPPCVYLRDSLSLLLGNRRQCFYSEQCFASGRADTILEGQKINLTGNYKSISRALTITNL